MYKGRTSGFGNSNRRRAKKIVELFLEITDERVGYLFSGLKGAEPSEIERVRMRKRRRNSSRGRLWSPL